MADQFIELWPNLIKSNGVLEISRQVRTAEKQVVGTFEKCFARPSSHSESEIFQLFCRYVQTFLDIVADRSACATLSI